MNRTLIALVLFTTTAQPIRSSACTPYSLEPTQNLTTQRVLKSILKKEETGRPLFEVNSFESMIYQPEIIYSVFVKNDDNNTSSLFFFPPDACGSGGGCAIWGYEKEGKDWKRIFDDRGSEAPIEILTSSTDGHHDIRTLEPGDRNHETVRVFSWKSDHYSVTSTNRLTYADAGKNNMQVS